MCVSRYLGDHKSKITCEFAFTHDENLVVLMTFPLCEGCHLNEVCTINHLCV